jgi:hypothetical protein
MLYSRPCEYAIRAMAYLAQSAPDTRVQVQEIAAAEMIKEGQTEVFSCSTTEGVGFAAAAGVPLYVTDGVFEHSQSLHPEAPEEDADLVQPKAKVTLH